MWRWRITHVLRRWMRRYMMVIDGEISLSFLLRFQFLLQHVTRQTPDASLASQFYYGLKQTHHVSQDPTNSTNSNLTFHKKFK